MLSLLRDLVRRFFTLRNLTVQRLCFLNLVLSMCRIGLILMVLTVIYAICLLNLSWVIPLFSLPVLLCLVTFLAFLLIPLTLLILSRMLSDLLTSCPMMSRRRVIMIGASILLSWLLITETLLLCYLLTYRLPILIILQRTV